MATGPSNSQTEYNDFVPHCKPSQVSTCELLLIYHVSAKILLRTKMRLNIGSKVSKISQESIFIFLNSLGTVVYKHHHQHHDIFSIKLRTVRLLFWQHYLDQYHVSLLVWHPQRGISIHLSQLLKLSMKHSAALLAIGSHSVKLPGPQSITV